MFSIGKPDIIAYDIYHVSTCIGFALIRKYSDTGYFLWDYAIDTAYQNKGYGTLALTYLLKLLVQEFQATEISTTYKCGNEVAKHLYEKLGFIKRDIETDDEENIYEVNLIKYLKQGE